LETGILKSFKTVMKKIFFLLFIASVTNSILNANTNFDQFDNINLGGASFTQLVITDNINNKNQIVLNVFIAKFSSLPFINGVAVFDGTCVITNAVDKFSRSSSKTGLIKITRIADSLNHTTANAFDGSIIFLIF